eukprot:scaffold3323_cov30-Prasinocladus_malaysianus.AAC.3
MMRCHLDKYRASTRTSTSTYGHGHGSLVSYEYIFFQSSNNAVTTRTRTEAKQCWVTILLSSGRTLASTYEYSYCRTSRVARRPHEPLGARPRQVAHAPPAAARAQSGERSSGKTQLLSAANAGRTTRTCHAPPINFFKLSPCHLKRAPASLSISAPRRHL